VHLHNTLQLQWAVEFVLTGTKANVTITLVFRKSLVGRKLETGVHI